MNWLFCNDSMKFKWFEIEIEWNETINRTDIYLYENDHSIDRQQTNDWVSLLFRRMENSKQKEK